MGVHTKTSISSENGYLAPFEKLFFSKYYVSVHKFFFQSSIWNKNEKTVKTPFEILCWSKWSETMFYFLTWLFRIHYVHKIIGMFRNIQPFFNSADISWMLKNTPNFYHFSMYPKCWNQKIKQDSDNFGASGNRANGIRASGGLPVSFRLCWT